MQTRPSPLHLLAPGALGGLESVVRMLATGQQRRGQPVSVGLVVDAGGSEHPLAEDLRGAGIAVREVPVGARAYLEERRRVAALCREVGPSVVHTHGYRADVLAGSAARSAGLPVVSTVHGFTGGGFKNRLYERLQRLALRRADAVVAVSRPLAEGLEASGVPGKRIRLIPNGWTGVPPLPRDEARRILGVPADAVAVGWVGRLSAEKGPDVMVAATPHLRPDVRVSFLGEGRERAALESQAAALGIGDRVRWHGAVPDAGRLMAAFDVFALSSRTEGTPIALFEAMAAGVPVVVTAVGGVPDVVTTRESLLVAPDDPRALARAIGTVLEQPAEAHARAALARERLGQVYSADAWLDRYDEVYRDIESQGRRS